MKTKLIRSLFLLTAILCFTAVQAQKKPFYDTPEEVIEAAYNALDQEMKGGEITTWAQENGIEGAYTFDLTIKHKGEVATVRTIDRKGGDIPSQNRLKDYVKTMRFPFKMPKNRSYKFQYEFKF